MKKIFPLVLVISFILGCSSSIPPSYVPDEHPYQYKVYGGFSQVVDAAIASLNSFGWVVEKQVDPSIYERTAFVESDTVKQTLIFAKPKKRMLSLGKENDRVNIVLRTVQDSSIEIEIRYMSVTSIPFKKFYNYQNDKIAQKLFKDIEQRINTPHPQ